ncbi:TniB family NTP-binding protein [Paenibacillus tyrfis]|nr:TniB family NTP-binding protein [Paenibacillus tyrfis]
MIVYGRPRIGKSKSIEFALNYLPMQLGTLFPILRTKCSSYRVPTEEKFFGDMLSDLKFPFPAKRNPSAMRQQIVNLMLEQGERSRMRRIMLVIDEDFMFLRYSGTKGIGKPFLQLSVLRSLDRFAERVNIIDENGRRFHFKATAFKHRFGLKIMKAGLNMAQVHQLIANVTSEMPMIYARKILKESLQNNG